MKLIRMVAIVAAALFVLAVGTGRLVGFVVSSLVDDLFSPHAKRGQLGAAQLLPLQAFTNVVATGVAVSDLRHLFGYTIERIVLKLGGTALTKAMLTGIQLKANGKVIVDTAGTQTDLRQTFRGIAATANYLTIDFLEIKARTKLGMMGGAMDTTLGIKDLRLEVTIAGATAPTLAGWAEVSIPQLTPEYQNVRPLIAKIHRNTQTIGAAGTFALQIPHLDPNAGGSIFKRVDVFCANMTGGRIERNGIREWDMDTKAANDFNQAEYGRVTQAGLWVFDFVVDGLQEDRVLDTRPAARCTTAQAYGTFSAGETIIVESEVLEPLDVY